MKIRSLGILFLLYAVNTLGAVEKVQCKSMDEVTEFLDIAKESNDYKQVTVRETEKGRIVKVLNLKKKK
jgi:hypothetical protein